MVRICALDAEQAGILPGLAADLRHRSAGAGSVGAAAGPARGDQALVEGRADLALGFLWDLPDSIAAETLYREGFLVAGLPGRLPGAPALDLARYAAADHILVSPVGDLRGVVDETLAGDRAGAAGGAGAAGVPAGAGAAAATGALVTLPSRIARGFAPASDWSPPPRRWRSATFR